MPAGAFGRFGGASAAYQTFTRGRLIDEDAEPMKTQVGGTHYTKLKIQPIDYILANDLGFPEGAVVKYVTRWKDKGGLQDLEKARHMLELYISALKSGEREAVVAAMRGAIRT